MADHRFGWLVLIANVRFPAGSQCLLSTLSGRSNGPLIDAG
jgi:hypothetical protein